MEMIKERERPQWQEVLMFSKRRQDWKLPSKRNEQKFYGIPEILLSPSMTADKPASMRRSDRHTRLRLENPIVHPQKGATSWFFDIQKPKSVPNLRNDLIEAARDIYTTEMPLVSGQSQERVLLTERYALLEFEYTGTLSNAQAERLHEIEAQLDQLEDRDPVEQEADRRLAQTSDKLDEILSLLRSLPRKTSTKKDAEDMIL